MSVEGDLPKGWRRLTIAELGGNAPRVVQTGPFGAQLHSEDYVDDGVPFILIKNLQGTRLDTSDMPHISYADARRLSAYALKPGDIVFSRVGRVGSCFLVEQEQAGWIISGQMLRIRLSDDVIDKHYLLHALRSKPAQDAIIDASVGTTRQSINTQILSSLEVFIPPKEEQSAIAAVLSTLDRAIEQSEALIAKYQRIKTGLTHDLLTRGMDEYGQLRDPATHKFKPSPLGMIPEGWEVVELGKLVHILHGYAFSGKFFSEDDNGIILLTPGNFSVTGELYFETENTKYYSGYIPEEYVLKKGDVLVVMTDLTKEMAILGNTVRLYHPYKVLHNQRIGLVKIRGSEAVLSDYLVLMMNSPFCKSVVRATATGTTVRHTSPDKIRAAIVPVPEPTEQKRISDCAQVVDSSLHSQKLQLAKLQRLRTGLMQDLLIGKVSVEPLLAQ